jgi:NDP-sugar pyrophosphorylase family protein
VIAARALVSRSFIWDDCIVGEDAIVDSSVLADHCVVVPGDRLRSVTQVPERPAPAPERAEPADATPDAVVRELRPAADTQPKPVRLGFGFSRDRGDSAIFAKPRDPSTLT